MRRKSTLIIDVIMQLSMRVTAFQFTERFHLHQNVPSPCPGRQQAFPRPKWPSRYLPGWPSSRSRSQVWLASHGATPRGLVYGKRLESLLPALQCSAEKTFLTMICNRVLHRSHLHLSLAAICSRAAEDVRIAETTIGLNEAISQHIHVGAP